MNIGQITWETNVIECTSGLTVFFQDDNFTLNSVGDFMGNEYSRDSKEWKEAELHLAKKAVKEAKRLLND